MQIKYGQVYLFKNGKISTIDLTINENKNLKDFVISVEEEKLISSTNTIIYPYTPYLKYLNDGYSIIRYQENNEEKIIDIILAQNITIADRNNIEAISKTLPETKYAHIYNYVTSPYGNRFEFYDGELSNHYSQKSLTSIPTLQVLPLYLKDKTNELTDKEKKMFEKYRNYSLVDVLIGDTASKYPMINNSNAGVIVISNQQTVASTLKEMIHDKEFKFLLSYLHPNLNFNKKFNLMNAVNETNDILIQLYDHQLIVWLPEFINSFQIQELRKLIVQVEEINKICKKKEEPIIDLYTSFCAGDIGELNDIDELKNYLNSLEENQSKRAHK